MYEGPVQDLIDELGRLPGVGPKSAQRIAFHLLATEPADIERLQQALQKVKEGVSEDEAKKIKEQIDAAGGQVDIK